MTDSTSTGREISIEKYPLQLNYTILKLFTYIYVYTCFGWMYVCMYYILCICMYTMYTMSISSCCKGQKEKSKLKQESQTIMSHHVGAENQTQFLSKSNKCTKLFLITKTQWNVKNGLWFSYYKIENCLHRQILTPFCHCCLIKPI